MFSVTSQNTFLEDAQELGLPQTLGKVPLHLLTHTSMDQHLLQSNPFHFDSYIYSQVVSDVTPLEFDLAHLSQLVAQNLAGKRFIVNTLPDMHKDFCYKQPAEQEAAIGHVPHGVSQPLPAVFAVPLTSHQLTTLKTHCSHIQLEELQQIASKLTTLGQLAIQQQTAPEVQQQLLPDDLIRDAITAFSQAPQQPSLAHQRPTAGLFEKQGMQELCLKHLQPVVAFFTDQYQQQGYQFADLSVLLKAPIHADDAAQLKLCLAKGCAQDPENRHALTELIAALREAELETLPVQANQGATLHAVCEAWAYESSDFPLSVMDSKLMCSQYVAVMRVMLQVWFGNAPVTAVAGLSVPGCVCQVPILLLILRTMHSVALRQ